MEPVIDSLDAVASELRSATGLGTTQLSAAVLAFQMGALTGGVDARLLTHAAAVARLSESFGFRGAVRFPADETGPDCWFMLEDGDTVRVTLTSTAELGDPDRIGQPPVPSPTGSLDRINGAQASIVQAFIRAQGRDPSRDAGAWLVIYTRLGGFSDRIWEMLRGRFAREDSVAPFARAFVVDIGPEVRGFEL